MPALPSFFGGADILVCRQVGIRALLFSHSDEGTQPHTQSFCQVVGDFDSNADLAQFDGTDIGSVNARIVGILLLGPAQAFSSSPDSKAKTLAKILTMERGVYWHTEFYKGVWSKTPRVIIHKMSVDYNPQNPCLVNPVKVCLSKRE